ncbi:AN1-type zinc finger protein 5-like [Grus japonensis]|uniref:AN1-type zinc finger protein 5-like n=1 Tax=Grus japonensis TaxID=30415 RepID=A0ABC9WQE0_GRUJA
MEDPTPEQVETPEGGCGPWEAHVGASSWLDWWTREEGSPRQGRFAGRTCDLVGDPTLEQFAPEDTKVSAEGGGGAAPGTGAEIPLQPMVKTMVRQAVPLQLMEDDGGADIHLQPMKDPMLEQVDASKGGCDPMGSPCWSRLLAGPVAPWRKEPTPEQVCWQDL